MSHCVLRKTDQQQSSLRCILVMLADFKDEEQILKASKQRKKQNINYKAKDVNWHQMSENNIQRKTLTEQHFQRNCESKINMSFKY